MAKNFKVGIIISGDGKGGVRAIEATKNELRKLSKESRNATDRGRAMAKTFSRLNRDLGNVARNAALVGAGITALVGRSVIRATIEQEQAVTQLNQALESTGGVVGLSSKELIDYAASLQQVTTFGDEAIISMQSLLLTFTNIQGDEMKGATEAVLNISQRMGVDLKSAALQVGKALNDPVRGLDGLNRAGIQFTDAQKDVIKQLAETGQVAKAQQMILGELETQFGGSARAARDTFGGSIKAVQNAFGDLMEADGDGLGDVVTSLQGLEKTLTDPDTVQGARELTGVLIQGFGAVVEVLAEIPNFGRFIGETVGRILNGSDDPIEQVREQIAAVEADIKRIQGFGGAGLGILGIDADAMANRETRVAELSKKLEDLRAREKSLQDLFSQAPSKIDPATDATDRLNEASGGAASGLRGVNEEITTTGSSADESAATLQQLVDSLLPGEKAARDFADQFDILRTAMLEATDPQSAELYARALAALQEQFRNTGEEGENLKDVTNEFAEAIESAKVGFEDFDGPFRQSIDRMLDAMLTFDDATMKSGEAQTQARLKGFAQMGSALAGMAEEGSRAYQILTIAANAAAVANAIAGIANQANGDPYTAFARVAAMASMMASLGIQISGALGGGGGSSFTPGQQGSSGLATSGTVLGSSDPSESLSNSLDTLIDIARPELEYTSQMAASLRSIETALAGAGASAARVIGGLNPQGLDRLFLNLGGGLVDTLTGDVGDLASQSRYNVSQSDADFIRNLGGGDDAVEAFRQYRDSIGLITQGIVDTVVDATVLLGAEEGRIRSFIEGLDIGEIALDLNAEDVAEQFSEVFSGLADSIVQEVGGESIAYFQLAGEGLFETLTRVASGYDEASFYTERLGVQLADLGSVARGTTDIGVELLRNSLVDSETTIRSWAHGFESGTSEVVSGIGQLIEGFDGTAEGLYDFAATLFDARDSMKLLGFAARDIDADMLRAAGGLDSFSSALQTFERSFFTQDEQVGFATERLTAALQDVGVAALPTRENFVELVQQGIIPLDESIIDLADTVYNSGDAANDAAASFEDLTAAIESNVRRLSRTIASLRGQSVANVDIGFALEDVRNASDLSTLLGLIPGVESALLASMNEQIAAINDVRDAEIDVHRQRLDLLREEQRNIERLIDIGRSLQDFVTGLWFDTNLSIGTPQQQLDNAQQEFFRLINAARGGDVDAAGQLQGQASSVLNLARDIFASGPGYQAIFDTVTGALTSVSGQLTSKTPELEALETLIARQDVQIIQDVDIGQQIKDQFADRLESVRDVLQLINQAQYLTGDMQADAVQILQSALIDVLEDGKFDNFQGFQGVQDALRDVGVDIDQNGNIVSSAVEQGAAAQVSKTDQLLTSINARLGYANGLNITQYARAIYERLGKLDTLSGIYSRLGYSGGSNVTQFANAISGYTSRTLQAINAQNQSQGLSTYAMGGIANKPSIFGEAGPEAAVPLPDGRTIPVTINGGVSSDEVVRELRALRREMAEQDQTVALTVVTEDGRVIREETIADIKKRSKRGETVVFKAGVAA